VHRSALLAGITLVVVGGVWVGQGMGWLRGSSFMVDDVRWALIGIVLVLGGLALATRGVRGRG
jgi:hypothetical protein